MFVRTKSVKGRQYAYKVKNSWTKAGARQKVVGYLGRCIEIKPTKSVSFHTFIGDETFLDVNSARDIMKAAIKFELHKHGFKRTKEHVLEKDNIFVDLNRLKVYSRKFNYVLHLNGDFLCGFTMRKLLNIEYKGEDTDEFAKRLVQTFIQAGIPAEPEVVAAVYEKLIQ